MSYPQKPPTSKRDLMNRILSYDFDGDIRTLAPGASIVRRSPSVLELYFPETNKTFILSIHIPREEKPDEWAVPTTRRAKRKQ